MTVRSSLRAAAIPLAREARAKFDDAEVRQARLLVRRLQVGPPRVVHFGASESIHIGLHDVDRRTLPIMIRDQLADRADLYSVVGAGYQPDLFQAYLRQLSALPFRPVLLVGIPVRIGFRQWWEHPRYGYRRAVERVSALPIDGNPMLMRRPNRNPSDAEMARYDAAPLASFLGAHPRGFYRSRLRDQLSSGLTSDHSTELRFAYFWGGVEDVADEWLGCVTELGRYAREAGFVVVPYHMPLPMQQGTDVWPGFRDHVTTNLDKLESAFRSGYGQVDFVRDGCAMGAEYFNDPTDASEHVNDSGRQQLAATMVSRLNAVL